jgi:protein-tyrosine-phosphatase
MKPLKSKSPSWKRIASQFLPARLQNHLRELRGLSPAERRAHVSVTLRRFASAPDAIPQSLNANGSVLFVCYGNIIRSALAAALTRHHGESSGIALTRVESAGLAARPGREADARAVTAGRSLGVDLTEHRAQPVTRSLVDDASVIYVMDRLNEAKLLAQFPDAASKTRRLGSLAPTDDGDVIEDPYVLDAAAVASVAARIDQATRALVHELTRRAGRTSTPSR